MKLVITVKGICHFLELTYNLTFGTSSLSVTHLQIRQRAEIVHQSQFSGGGVRIAKDCYHFQTLVDKVWAVFESC